MAKKPTMARFAKMLAEIEMLPGEQHQPRTEALLRTMVTSPPDPYTPKPKKKRRAVKK